MGSSELHVSHTCVPWAPASPLGSALSLALWRLLCAYEHSVGRDSRGLADSYSSLFALLPSVWRAPALDLPTFKLCLPGLPPV